MTHEMMDLLFQEVVLSKLHRMERKLDFVIRQGAKMARELEDLTAEVTENGTVIDSVIVLLGNLSQMIRDSAGNPTALRALANTLDSKSKSLADAIVANTPVVAPPTPPGPAPT